MSRVASKQNLRPCWSIRQLAVAAGIVSWFTGTASAQTATLGQPVGAPLVGQVPFRSPLSTSAVENRPRFDLVPSLRTVYDSNVLRFVDSQSGPHDNIRITPGIDLNYKRLFGRVLFGISGSAGYDFNSRFKSLNQSRIDFSGSARAPVGSICSFDTAASYYRATFDLNDTQIDDGRNQFGAVSTIQNYSVSASCKRRAGFSPIAGFDYQKLSNSRLPILNVERYNGNVGISYAQPSLGVISLNAIYNNLRRPFVTELTGVNDDTNIYGISIGLNRAVSPRLQINASGGLTKAVPNREGVSGFVGTSYNGLLQWTPTSRLSITGIAARQVTAQNGVNATYVIREDYTVSAGYKVSAKSQVTLGGTRTLRDFRGETLFPSLEPLRTDELNSLSASYNYDLTPRLRIGVGTSRRWRTADNPAYDYKSTVVSSSIGAHF